MTVTESRWRPHLQIVDIMEKQGYEFVTADELIIN